jgi:hypothetical protein
LAEWGVGVETAVTLGAVSASAQSNLLVVWLALMMGLGTAIVWGNGRWKNRRFQKLLLLEFVSDAQIRKERAIWGICD